MNTSSAPQMIEYANKSLDFTPHDTKWLPGGTAKLAVAGVSPSGKGVLSIHELDRDGTKGLFHDLSFQSSGIKCASFGASRLGEGHLAMGCFDGSLSICDVNVATRDGNKSELFGVKAHDGIINALDGVGGTNCSYGAPELVTGGKDGCVKVWDQRTTKPVVTLNPDKSSSARDCWTVAFGDSYNNEERSILAGFDNGDVKLFDLRTSKIVWETNVENGVTSVQFDRQDIKKNKLVVTTLESQFKCFDMRTQHPTDGFAFTSERAHRSTVWLSKFLPQNRDIFLTGGGNGGLNIYKYHYPQNRVGKHVQDGAAIGIAGSVELLNSRVISTQPVTSFDWSPDRQGLCCLSSMDQTFRVFVVTKLEKH